MWGLSLFFDESRGRSLPESNRCLSAWTVFLLELAAVTRSLDLDQYEIFNLDSGRSVPSLTQNIFRVGIQGLGYTLAALPVVENQE